MNIGLLQKLTLSNCQTWARPDDGMYWDNAQNWCEALGFKPALLADLGCNNLVLGTTCDTTITTELQNEWKTGQYSHFWIDRHEYPGGAYTLNLYLKRVSSDGKNAHQMYPLCFTP